jgi:hypothetical protein
MGGRSAASESEAAAELASLISFSQWIMWRIVSEEAEGAQPRRTCPALGKATHE